MRLTKYANGESTLGSKVLVLSVLGIMLHWMASVAVVAAPLPKQPLATVKEALHAWKHENWTKMYGFMSSADRAKIPIKAFITKQRTLAIVDKLMGYRILDVTVADSNDVFVKLALITRRWRYTTFLPSKTSHLDTTITKWHLINEGKAGWKITFLDKRKPALQRKKENK